MVSFRVFILAYVLLIDAKTNFQNVSPKNCISKKRILDGAITWSYAKVVMCILTRKYQGAFCCSSHGVESLLNFMFPLKHEISL